MASIDDGELYLEIEGASEEQLRKGIIAARQEFEKSGVPIKAAFFSYFNRDGAIMTGLLADLSSKDRLQARVIDYAIIAAQIAAKVELADGVIIELAIYEAILRANIAEDGYPARRPPDEPMARTPGPHFHLEKWPILEG